MTKYVVDTDYLTELDENMNPNVDGAESPVEDWEAVLNAEELADQLELFVEDDDLEITFHADELYLIVSALRVFSAAEAALTEVIDYHADQDDDQFIDNVDPLDDVDQDLQFFDPVEKREDV